MGYLILVPMTKKCTFLGPRKTGLLICQPLYAAKAYSMAVKEIITTCHLWPQDELISP